MGHLVKSRAIENHIEYNKLTHEDTNEESWRFNSNIDMPQGGIAYVIGNILHQGPKGGRFMLSYAKENQDNPGCNCYIINNTFINESSECTFLHCPVEGYNVNFVNNIFCGAVNLTTGPATWKGDNNLLTTDFSMFNSASCNYSLKAVAKEAIDKGIDPGEGDGCSLLPAKQYDDKCNFKDRVIKGSAIDMGALEFGV